MWPPLAYSSRILEFTRLIGGMPFWIAVAVVIIAAFGLAAFAIYAELSSSHALLTFCIQPSR